MDFKKVAETLLPVVLALFLLPNFGFAAEPEPAPIIEIDLQGVIDSVNGMFSGLSESIAGIPASVVGYFSGLLRASVVGFIEPLFLVMKALILYNVNPFNFEG